MRISNELELDYASPPRWRKRLLWSGLALLVVLSIGGIVWLKWNEHAAQDALSAVIAELDATDPQWRLDDIEAARRMIPDEENSALVIMRIAGQMPKPQAFPAGDQSKPWDDRLRESSVECELEPDIYWDLRQELKGIQPLVQQARGLARLKDGRYPITYAPNFIGTTIKCQDAREVATLLQKDLLIRARENDIDGAMESAHASVVVARSIGDEPLLVSQLVRIACESVAARNVERVLAQGQASNLVLANLQSLLEEESTTSFFLISLRGERAGLSMLLRAIEDGKVSSKWWTGLSAQQQPSDPVSGIWDSLTFSPAARLAHPILLRKLTECIEIAQLPPEQQMDRLQVWEQQFKDPKLPGLVRDLVQATSRPAAADIRVKAVLNCAVAALAVERFRLANRRWPTNLTEVIPALLKQVPPDPYDGKPLRYRVIEDGVVIYSIGPDRQDDRGKVDPEKPLGPGSDIVFRLWNVDARRKPARNPDVGPPQPTKEDLERMELERMQQEWQLPAAEKPKVP